MAYRSALLMLLCFGMPLLAQSNAASMPKRLRGLRHFRVDGIAGRFQVNRGALEKIISEYSGDEEAISLPTALDLPHVNYDDARFGEVLLVEILVHETISDGEEPVPTVRRVLKLWAPIMINGAHGILQLGDVTDDQSQKAFPNHHSRAGTTVVDSISDTEYSYGHSVTYTDGDGSVIRMTFRYNATCTEDDRGRAVGRDIDQVTGRKLRSLALHGGFDWGCGDFAADYGYCRKLKNYQRELEAAEGNVCLEFEVSRSRRCPADMARIDEVSGTFSERFPYLTEHAASFEVEFLDREATTSVVFPCLV